MLTLDAKRSESLVSLDLIEDVLLEIFLRLPVKTLVRFKCVCKHWHTIIESQSFVKQHFSQRSNQERLLVRHYKRNEDLHAYALFVDDICSGFEEPAHLQMPNMILELLGPVNGVFCLVGQSRDLALLNPATRQLKPLPELPEVIVDPHLLFLDNVLGFGLDPLSGDYKVISVWYLWNRSVIAPDCHPITFVYNLGSDSWRILEDVGCFESSYRACRSICNTYTNGVYYWTMEFSNTNVAAILSFDMATEKFKEIQVPDCLKSKIGHLTVHNDSIALLSYQLERNDLCEVWLMEKEGSWNRGAVVGPCQAINWPLCLWKNNLLIEADSSFLMLYNICTKKRQLTQARVKKNTSFISWVFSYKESLVSIKGKGDNCMFWDASPDILTIAWENKDQLTRPLHGITSQSDSLWYQKSSICHGHEVSSKTGPHGCALNRTWIERNIAQSGNCAGA
ncbi:hypothetical protein ACS0TY_035801 [Phlomoides rotata]